MSSGPPERGSAAPESTPRGSARVLVVQPAEAGQRWDHFLSSRLGVSRAEARRLLARGVVRSGVRALALSHKGRLVAAGERCEVADFRPPEQEPVVPARIDPERLLEILAEGPGWVAVAKPAGVGVHPLRPAEVGCVLNEIVLRHPEIQGIGEAGLRSGVVHRLDVDTSGVLLVATGQEAWTRLRAAFAEHRIEKRYRAVVEGSLAHEGRVATSLAVRRHRPARVEAVAVGTPRSRATELSVHPLETLPDATLVEVRPRTGFLHQIRATLAHLGHPVMGDTLYGAAQGRAPRQLLHAAHARFEEIDVHAPDADDFAAALAALREAR